MLTTLSLVLLAQAAAPIPRAECRTSNNVQACGFHCIAELDQVKCAQTPQGFCTRKERQVVCWDPPEELRLHAPEKVSSATCHAKYRDVTCGFACTSSPNHLACAQTPWGVCVTRFDDVACWDPSPAVVHHLPQAELAGAKCVQTNEMFACGYDCKTSWQSAACAQTPRGKCNIVEGKILCFDPPLPSITHEPVRTK